MSATAQLRIARLASDRQVHRAFHWLHLHQPQLRRWQLEILRIPAPPFGEGPRAEWFLHHFDELGLENPRIDSVGNALAQLDPPNQHDPSSPVILLSAHLDTVFPEVTPTEPSEAGSRIIGPGACDNASGLVALLGMIAALRYAEIVPPVSILFAANVGEEGEGNLRGMRHLFTDSPYAGRIAAAIALEGGGNSAVTTRALASRRFRVTMTGPGGHAWADAGTPNPVLLLARSLLELQFLENASTDRSRPRTTFNVGQFSGGTSINSIPEFATALLDLRSSDPRQLEHAESAIRQTLDNSVADNPVSLTLETIGDRPGGALPDDSSLLDTLRAVDRHLNLRTEPGLGSTDANIPLSLGIPAMAIGAGGTGGGVHTLQEWHDPTDRTPALRRIMLTLLDTAGTASQQTDPNKFSQ